MAQAKRDENQVTTLLAVSNSDGITPVVLWANPTTHRLLVSTTAGTLDDLSDVVITSGAQGDVLYHNGTNWVNLAPGTSGKFLKTQGAAANPIWDTATAGASGTDTQVQFNDGGASLGGDAGFVYNKTSNVATLGGLLVSGLTASEIVGTDASKNLASLAVATYPSLVELAYVKGVTSAIQTQLGNKAPTTAPTFATSITGSYLTASEILITGASKEVVSAAVATYPSLTELTYVKGVTSALQTQINAKGVGTWTDSSSSTGANKTLTAPVINAGSISGIVTLVESTSIDLDPAQADQTWTGITRTGTAGATLAFGDLCYLAVADSRWELTDADAAATAGGVMLGMCVLAAAADGSATRMLLLGNIQAASKFPTMTVGAVVYVGDTTAGTVQVAIPTGADNVIRVVGFALTADEIYFNPSQDHQVTVA